MRKFEYKYKIDEEKRTVVAMSTFAGKTVAGVARCDPRDEFNVNDGKKLAAARCSVKVAEKRMKRAELCYEIAVEAMKYWSERVAKMKHYKDDAITAYEAAYDALTNIEEKFCE
jgi:hypothetical protein